MAEQLQYILKLVKNLKLHHSSWAVGESCFRGWDAPNSHVHTFLECPKNVYPTPSANQSHVTWHLREKFSERSTVHGLNPAFSVSTLLCQSCHVVIKTIGTKQLHLAWFLQITKHHGNHLLSATPCNREKVERWPNFSPRPILCRFFLAHALQIGV